MNKHFFKPSFLIPVIYLLIVSIFLVWHRAWFSPDQFFAAALLVTLVFGKFKKFVKDWSPPVVLFLSYEYLRGLAPKLTAEAHIFPMINFDKAVFGDIPTIKLQNLLFSAGTVRWYDYLAIILYVSHFIVPMMVGFVFWLNNKEYFRNYFWALLLLSYLAFITFIIFPAMPPWMASQQGYIPAIPKIMDTVFANFSRPIHLPTVYQFFGANLVAAVPSLHAAFPWLTFLFILKRFRYFGLMAFPYVFGVWFAIVYLGEHYVFDIVIAVLYATFIFLLVTQREQVQNKIFSLLHIPIKKEVS